MSELFDKVFVVSARARSVPLFRLHNTLIASLLTTMDLSSNAIIENRGEIMTLTFVRNVASNNSIHVLVEAVEAALISIFRNVLMLNPNVLITEQESASENGKISATWHIQTNGQVTALNAFYSAVVLTFHEMNYRLGIMQGLNDHADDGVQSN
ncbi:uncharacterized protein LOC119689669 [Teleopsis dalmanni]|uniref:uncharacterized protein LOC119689669 n=1 Tax=Teleopsis dalmanni TaxID=139649 RepID=UPI0018CF59E9|nr:uncharacterized protein LOC119689669 [Teleopsis dalmanni]